MSTQTKRKRIKKTPHLEAAEKGVKAAQDVFAKIVRKSDPPPKKERKK